MKIVDYNYRRPEHLSMNILEELDSIAIHNTGSDNDIDTDTDWHMDNNKWVFNGYGYYIDKDGTIYKVRGHEYMNAGVMFHNSHIVSVALRGNFEVDEPTPLQLESLAYLIDYIKKECRNIQTVAGHNKWNHTSCPGKNFTLSNLDKYKRNFVQKSDELEEIKQKLDKLQADYEALDRKVDRIVKSVDRKLGR